MKDTSRLPSKFDHSSDSDVPDAILPWNLNVKLSGTAFVSRWAVKKIMTHATSGQHPQICIIE